MDDNAKLMLKPQAEKFDIFKTVSKQMQSPESIKATTNIAGPLNKPE